MNIQITPGPLRGDLTVIPSKSQAHRALICAALADWTTDILCDQVNRDMEATAQCLEALGADITRTEVGYRVVPIRELPKKAKLPCRDSGSTLRFLLPVVGALGVDTTFFLEGRLPQRPLSPLWEEMERMGCQLSRPTETTVRVRGQLYPGDYTIRGDISSQFITGLLLAGAIIPGETRIHIEGPLQSKPYVAMTRQMMKLFDRDTENLTLSGGYPFVSPGTLIIEGDWSSGAFFLVANALGSQIRIAGLKNDSCQGDRAVADLIQGLNQPMVISAADIPDLVPILSVLAACRQGAVFTDISRLRLKESDRVASTLAMIRALGGSVEAQWDNFRIYGTGLKGGVVDAVGDHRIAMSAAIAATACEGPVIIKGAECVSKSYPKFFKEFSRLGGHYEQYLR